VRRHRNADRGGMVAALVDERERRRGDREEQVGAVVVQVLIGQPAQERLRERGDGIAPLGQGLELDAGEECVEDGVQRVRLLGGLGHGGSRLGASMWLRWNGWVLTS